MQSIKERMGYEPLLGHRDIVAEAIDLSGGRVECECGVGFLAALLSAIGERRVQAGTVFLGDLTVQGNIKALPSITEVIQLARDNGALRVLLPTGNKSQFASLPEDVVEDIDVVFYGDLDRAVARIVEL